jgi:hypothetical protein
MSRNVQRTIVWLVFAVGLILGILGWTNSAYSSTAGTITFLCCLLALPLEYCGSLKEKGNSGENKKRAKLDCYPKRG